MEDTEPRKLFADLPEDFRNKIQEMLKNYNLALPNPGPRQSIKPILNLHAQELTNKLNPLPRELADPFYGLERLLEDGNYERHLEDLRNVYKGYISSGKRENKGEYGIAVLELLHNFGCEMQPPSPPIMKTKLGHRYTNTEDAIVRAWISPIVVSGNRIGDPLYHLHRILKESEGTTQDPGHYAHSLVILQSSGMGKSRLVDRLGETCITLTFTFRDTKDTGYPPNDVEITKWLQSIPAEKPKRAHAAAYGFILAVLENLSSYLENTGLKPIATAKRLHDEMAPGRRAPYDRSPKRRTLYTSIQITAEKYYNELLADESWRKIFHDSQDRRRDIDTRFGPKLRETADKLLRGRDNQYMVIALDEVSRLMQSNTSAGLYHALLRIMHCLKKHPIWLLCISTDSAISTLLPPDGSEKISPRHKDSSARQIGIDQKLCRFAPFTQLPLDVMYMRAIEQLQNDEPCVLSLVTLQKARGSDIMKLFGRPLWAGYPKDCIFDFAKTKLLANMAYDPNKREHVFAALTFRVCLEVVTEHVDSYKFSREIVDSHMQVLLKVNQEKSIVRTTTPSEPILSVAARRVLYRKRNPTKENLKHSNWRVTINTLIYNLLSPGLIDKGRKGELFARILMTMAADCCLRECFTVEDFLKELFATGHHEKISSLPQKLKTALIQFNHFVAYGERVPSLTLTDLSKNLREGLIRSYAIQCSHNQPTVDLIIPIFFGADEDEITEDQVGFIGIQVKARKQASGLTLCFPSLKPATKSELLLTRSTSGKPTAEPESVESIQCPTLWILLDLNVESVSKPFEVCKSDRNEDSAIHAQGNNEKLFGCLGTMGCSNGVCQELFSQVVTPKQLDPISFSNLKFASWNPSTREKIGDDSDADE